MDRPAFYLWSLVDAWGWFVHLPILGAVASVIAGLAFWMLIGGIIYHKDRY